jgi:ribosomal protein S24E
MKESRHEYYIDDNCLCKVFNNNPILSESENKYLIVNKKTKISHLVKTNDIRNWMIRYLDLSDDYIVIEQKYFDTIKKALNES